MAINYFQRLADLGLSRLLQHMENPFGIVSAHVGTNTATAEGRHLNNQKQEELKVFLRAEGIVFIPLLGGWKDTVLHKIIPEDSLFLTNANKEFVAELAKRFNQQAYIYGDKGQYTIFNSQNQELQSGNIVDHIKVDAVQQTDGVLDHSKPTERQNLMDQSFTDIGGKRFMLKKPDTEANAYSHYFFIHANEHPLGVNRQGYGPVQVKTAGINDRLTTQYGGLLAVFIPLVEILPSSHTVHPSK